MLFRIDIPAEDPHTNKVFLRHIYVDTVGYNSPSLVELTTVVTKLRDGECREDEYKILKSCLETLKVLDKLPVISCQGQIGECFAFEHPKFGKVSMEIQYISPVKITKDGITL